ncbi:ABC transporter permease [Leifsonia shinshuensis]|uniref:ABC transporter permease n=1 Tax=Leifsonia shinshuensis TaxID=150026 RepID=A0A7G6YE17_9MICO|nr:ABC transporter permease [Leifsonia shinshuensis]QNE36732.1 ABC transporter permease [Leifsonia shinshuensis]
MNSQLAWLQNNLAWIGELTVSHLYLSIIPVIIGLAIALPIGWLAHRYRAVLPVIVAGSSLLYTIPSLAFFVLMPVIIGTKILDPLNVVIALTVYTIALLVRVVADGLGSVPEEAVQAATGMGYTPVQRLLRVQLPVAVPVIGAGLRVAVVANVSVVSMAALIGIPQLGSLFTYGLQVFQMLPVIIGILLSAVLALGLDLLVQGSIRGLTPWNRRMRGAS